MTIQTEVDEREFLQEQAALLRHELRNPLAVILGNASYLLRTTSISERMESLSDIQAGAERALAIVNAFLKPASPDQAEPVSMQAACRQVLEEFLHSRPIELQFEDALPPARAGQVQVGQVLQNLVSNADKYSPMGMPIVISINREFGTLLVCVSDYGAGIPLSEQENVFRFRYRMEQHKDEAGAGLGLIVCQQLVEGWSGEIWYEARPGFGATFCFTVPLWESEG